MRKTRHRGYLFKTIRADQYDFWEKSVREFLDPEIEEHRTEKRRLSSRLPYTVRFNPAKKRNEVVSTNKQERKPLYTKKQKRSVSKHQSTSYANPDAGYTPKFFGWDRDRKDVVVGVCFDPKDCLLWLISIYDGGTFYRYKDFQSEFDAKAYIEKATKTLLLHTSLEELVKYGKEKPDDYNEVLAGVKWNCDGTSKIVIFSDNAESRLLAILRALDLQDHLEKKYPQKKPITVPIVIYPNFKTVYTAADAKRDMQAAHDNVALQGYLAAIHYSKTKTVSPDFSYAALIDAAELLSKIREHYLEEFLRIICSKEYEPLFLKFIEQSCSANTIKKLIALAEKKETIALLIRDHFMTILNKPYFLEKLCFHIQSTHHYALLLQLYKLTKIPDTVAWHTMLLTELAKIKYSADDMIKLTLQDGDIAILLQLMTEREATGMREGLNPETLLLVIRRAKQKELVPELVLLLKTMLQENPIWGDTLLQEAMLKNHELLFALYDLSREAAPELRQIVIDVVVKSQKEYWVDFLEDPNQKYTKLSIFMLLAAEKEAVSLRLALAETLPKLNVEGKQLAIEKILLTEPTQSFFLKARLQKLLCDVMEMANTSNDGSRELCEALLKLLKIPTTYYLSVAMDIIRGNERSVIQLLQLANKSTSESKRLLQWLITYLASYLAGKNRKWALSNFSKASPLVFSEMLLIAIKIPDLKTPMLNILMRLLFEYEHHEHNKKNTEKTLQFFISRVTSELFVDILKNISIHYSEIQIYVTESDGVYSSHEVTVKTYCLAILDQVIRTIPLSTIDMLKISIIATITLFLHHNHIYAEKDLSALTGFFSSKIQRGKLLDAWNLLKTVETAPDAVCIREAVTASQVHNAQLDSQKIIAVGKSDYTKALGVFVAAVDEYEHVLSHPPETAPDITVLRWF